MEEYRQHAVDRLKDMELDELGNIVNHGDEYEPYVVEAAKVQMETRFGIVYKKENDGITYVDGEGRVVGHQKLVVEPGMKWYHFKMYIQMPLAMMGYVGQAVFPFFALATLEMTDELGSLVFSPVYLFLLVVWWITLHKMRTFAKNAMSWIYTVIWIPVGFQVFNVLAEVIASAFSDALWIGEVVKLLALLGVSLAEVTYFQKRRFLFNKE